MGEQSKDFLDRHDVRQALDELFEKCVAEYEESGESPSCDVAAFLRERGIESPADSSPRLSQRVAESKQGTVAPEIIIDPDTGKRCYERCVWGKRGELVCHMVCF